LEQFPQLVRHHALDHHHTGRLPTTPNETTSKGVDIHHKIMIKGGYPASPPTTEQSHWLDTPVNSAKAPRQWLRGR
ncbi:hypothetical protein, partial [Streptomyces spiralis]